MVVLRAAMEAHDASVQVLIMSKSKKGNPHTVLARGGSWYYESRR